MNSWTCSCNREIELRFNVCPFCKSMIPNKEVKRIAKIEYEIQKIYFDDLAIKRNNLVFERLYHKYISKKWIRNMIMIFLISVILIYGYTTGIHQLTYRFSNGITKNNNIEAIVENYKDKISSNVKIRDLSNVKSNVIALIKNKSISDYNVQDLKAIAERFEKIISKWRSINVK